MPNDNLILKLQKCLRKITSTSLSTLEIRQKKLKKKRAGKYHFFYVCYWQNYFVSNWHGILSSIRHHAVSHYPWFYKMISISHIMSTNKINKFFGLSDLTVGSWSQVFISTKLKWTHTICRLVQILNTLFIPLPTIVSNWIFIQIININDDTQIK